ncbi:hypothetical protein GCM10022393_37800 [Aquimarina addita]|uniref:Tobe domain protein n=1 Tax=Aquimarina addita TaxID=870485 RepID=A0ABP6UVA5_9FLAO
MNAIQGHICDIQISTNLAVVSVQIKEDIVWKILIAETPDTASYLRIDNMIKLLFKETEVVITTNKQQAISIENGIEGVISDIEKGLLLSKLTINTKAGNVISILATEAVDRLMLEKHQEIIAMVQMNEIMVSI